MASTLTWMTHNDSLELHGGVCRYGDVVLGRIDVNAVLDEYFFDTDFLLDPGLLDSMAGEVKESMGFADDTWGVVHGLEPHPDELRLREVSPACFEEDPDDLRLYEPGREYPVERFEEQGGRGSTGDAPLEGHRSGPCPR